MPMPYTSAPLLVTPELSLPGYKPSLWVRHTFTTQDTAFATKPVATCLHGITYVTHDSWQGCNAANAMCLDTVAIVPGSSLPKGQAIALG